MKPLFSILLLLSFYSSFSQKKLTGKWYTFSSDMFKVIEYDFDKTTFTSNKLDWELNIQAGTQTAQISRTIEQNGNLYYLLKDNLDTSITTLLIFSSFKRDSSFIQATASDEHTNFKTEQDALAFIQVDTFKRVGLTFYSTKEFSRSRSMPDPLTITKEKYTLYLRGLIAERQKFEAFSSKHKDDFGFMFFFVFISNQAKTVLANVGYNPIIDDQHLEKVNDKFKTDIDLKDLIDEALNFQWAGLPGKK